MKRQVFWIVILGFSMALSTCEEGCTPVTECCNDDSPNCPGFVNDGAWRGSGTFIQDVALPTVGTRESILDNGGKPYYQMCLGMDSGEEASFAACLMEAFPDAFDDDADDGNPDALNRWERNAWCSETVSFWHYQAGIPYPSGYRNSGWLLGWQLVGSNSIRLFYDTDERGRWIQDDIMNPSDIQLGINAPLPGAYMRIVGLDPGTNTWVSDDDYPRHSLMVDSLTIYMDGATGRILDVGATFLEGNSGNRVRNDRKLESIYAYLPGGDEIFGTKNGNVGKIYGFGIDRDADGNPIYDPSRIDTILLMRIVPWQALATRDPWWEEVHAPNLPAYRAYARQVRNGVQVSASLPGFDWKGVPDDKAITWAFEASRLKDESQPLEVTIDLLGEHPLPIRGILLEWGDAYLPQGYQVLWAGDDGRYREAPVPQISIDKLDAKPEFRLPVPVVFGQGEARVRFVKLVFPAGAFRQDALLRSISFSYNVGPDRDGELD